jgi:hypothetical protein
MAKSCASPFGFNWLSSFPTQLAQVPARSTPGPIFQ